VSQPSWADVEAAVRAESSRRGVTVGAPVPEEVIAAAEEVVGRFPESYRRFVAEFGWIETPTYVFNGLGDGVPKSLDVVAETISEQRDLEPGLPEGFIVISSDGNGNVYCVESANADAAPDPLVMFRNHEVVGEEPTLEEYADSFVAMLHERAKWWNS
jgi:hypothetical protein